MFAKEVYTRRRKTLLSKMREAGQCGIVLKVDLIDVLELLQGLVRG